MKVFYAFFDSYLHNNLISLICHKTSTNEIFLVSHVPLPYFDKIFLKLQRVSSTVKFWQFVLLLYILLKSAANEELHPSTKKPREDDAGNVATFGTCDKVANRQRNNQQSHEGRSGTEQLQKQQLRQSDHLVLLMAKDEDQCQNKKSEDQRSDDVLVILYSI